MTGPSIRSQRLKAATRDLHRAVGGLESAAEITGKGKSQHGNYQNPNMPDFATIDAVAAMEAVARGTPGFPQVTTLLCQNAGGVFVPLPEMPDGEDEPALVLMKILTEYGEVSREITEALSNDSVIDAAEALRVLSKVGNAERLNAQLRRALETIAESGKAAA